jgi:predicted ABC-type ATPase
LAWKESADRLRQAIATRTSYTFETTLGGRTITSLLVEAVKAGLSLSVWYCGLASVELHLQRIAARVAAGGHGIPESKVRERFDASRTNLLRLMPIASKLVVYDNSYEAGLAPNPRLLLRLGDGVLDVPCSMAEFRDTPEWAQPLVAAAVESAREIPDFLK